MISLSGKNNKTGYVVYNQAVIYLYFALVVTFLTVYLIYIFDWHVKCDTYLLIILKPKIAMYMCNLILKYTFNN